MSAALPAELPLQGSASQRPTSQLRLAPPLNARGPAAAAIVGGSSAFMRPDADRAKAHTQPEDSQLHAGDPMHSAIDSAMASPDREFCQTQVRGAYTPTALPACR